MKAVSLFAYSRRARAESRQHTLRIAANLIVPESSDAPSVPLEPSRPPRVIVIVAMLPTVSFDHQAVLQANEIDDEGANRTFGVGICSPLSDGRAAAPTADARHQSW